MHRNATDLIISYLCAFPTYEPLFAPCEDPPGDTYPGVGRESD